MLYCEGKVWNQKGALLATGQGAFLVQNDDFVQMYAAKLREQGES